MVQAAGAPYNVYNTQTYQVMQHLAGLCMLFVMWFLLPYVGWMQCTLLVKSILHVTTHALDGIKGLYGSFGLRERG